MSTCKERERNENLHKKLQWEGVDFVQEREGFYYMRAPYTKISNQIGFNLIILFYYLKKTWENTRKHQRYWLTRIDIEKMKKLSALMPVVLP